MDENAESLEWRVHTAGLLQEIGINQGAGVLRAPLHIFANLLNQVATRASQLNDPVLNGLMAQLALYEIADPYSPHYDREIAEGLIKGKQQ